MEEIKRIYTLLSRSNGLKIKDIAAILDIDRFQLAEIMFSEDSFSYWYQNNESLWFAKDGAITIEEEKKKEVLTKQLQPVSGSKLEQHVYSESKPIQFYLKQILSFPTYSSKETNELFDLYRDGEMQAYDQIVKGHLKLVVNIAKMYRHRGVSMNDLIQEGNIGLLRAIERYDQTLNQDFVEYAKSWIFQSIIQSTLVLPHLLSIAPSIVPRHYNFINTLISLNKNKVLSLRYQKMSMKCFWG